MLGQVIEDAMKRVEETIFKLKKKKKPTIPFSVRVEALSAMPQSLEFLAAAEKLQKNESFRSGSSGTLHSSQTIKAAQALYRAYLCLAAGFFP